MTKVLRFLDSRWLAVLVLLALVVGYVAFLWPHITPYAGGADSSGYINSARLFTQGRWCAVPKALPGFDAREFGDLVHVPLGFMMRQDGRMVPTYSTGYPLQLMLAAILGWSHAVQLLNAITVLGCGGLMYALGRRVGLSVGLALGGVALLWACPLFLFSAVQPMSDLSALAWALLVLYSALRNRDDWKWSCGCGMALGMAVLVRPTNLLLVVPVLVAIGFRPRSWLLVGLGGLPWAVFLGYYNWLLYGSPFMTGYGDVLAALGRENIPHVAAHFAHWIPLLLSPLVVLALLAPGVALCRQRSMLVLLVWALVLMAFHAFYECSGETWWYLRFILPAFPCLILPALAVVETIRRNLGSRFRPIFWLVSGMIAGAVGWEACQVSEREVLSIHIGERNYFDSARWAQKNLPGHSAIFCMQVSGAYYCYADFTLLRWDFVREEKFDSLLDALARQRRPVYAALFPFETADALKRIGGHWTSLATVGQVTFWQRQP